MKLFLYSSYVIAPGHLDALTRLVGKPPQDITIAAIANATDPYPDANTWVPESIGSLTKQGAQVEVVDLRKWLENRDGLYETLANQDIIWVCGGQTYYLRWILKATGADDMIRALVQQGKVYAGWSAGAGMAGPTLRFFDLLDDPKEAPEVIWEGLHMTDAVVLPHIDLPDFAEGMKKIDPLMQQAGYRTVPLTEAMALVINGSEEKVI